MGDELRVSTAADDRAPDTGGPVPGTAVAFVETVGYIPAFDLADAMGKSATVRIGGMVRLGGGLIGMSVLGPLADVTEAVEVGEETVRAFHQVDVRSVIMPSPSAPVRGYAADPSRVGR
jgi:microcompartment protein CcmL/EutN